MCVSIQYLWFKIYLPCVNLNMSHDTYMYTYHTQKQRKINFEPGMKLKRMWN